MAYSKYYKMKDTYFSRQYQISVVSTFSNRRIFNIVLAVQFANFCNSME
jgi:hypothetical protein